MNKFRKGLLTMCLTATFLGGLVACNKPSAELEGARGYLYEILKDDVKDTADYELPARVSYNSVLYPVTWSVKVTSGDAANVKLGTPGEKFVPVDVVYDPVTSTADTVYVLTATITDDKGKTITQEFTRTIPKFQFTSHKAYLSAKKGDMINVEGYIVGRYPLYNGTTQVFLQTANGEGYYVYKLPVEEAKFDADMAIGNYIIVSGEKDIYSGTAEIINASYQLSSKADVTVEPYDITSLFESAANVQASELVNLQGSLVTIKDVVLTDMNESNGYLNFMKGNKNSYVRISSSGNCSDFDSTAKDTLKGNYPSKQFFKADVTGIVNQYNGSFYLMPTSKDSIKVTGTAMEPAFALDYAVNSLEVAETLVTDLPNKSGDVTITWASSVEGLVSEKGKLNPPAEPTVTTLTATLKLGDNTKTKVFENITVKMPDVRTVEYMLSSIAAGKSELAVVEGVVVAKDSSNRPYVMGEDGSVLFVYEKFSSLEVGETVKLLGTGTSYNGLYQLGSAKVLEESNTTVAVDYGKAVPMTPAAFNAACAKKDGSLNNKLIKIAGLTVVKPDKYFNFSYKDGEDDKIIQSLGKHDFLVDANVGKTVTVYGYYNGVSSSGEGKFVATKIVEGIVEDGDDVILPSAGVELDFSSLTEKGTAFTADTLTSTITAALGSNGSKLVSVTGNTIYNGNAQGGAHPETTGLIKFGKSKTGGELVLTFDENTQFTKVTIICHDWYASSEQYPTTSRTLTVNGVTLTNPYNATGEGEALVFDITASNVITIKSSERTFVWSIVLE